MKKRIIIANSPRLCKCLSYAPDEVRIINQKRRQKIAGKEIILFLPTFCKSDTEYVAPLEIPGFLDYLNTDNILWIQKNHSADKKDSIKTIEIEIIINLGSNFVVILYDELDLFISDYSSATTDAIY